MSAAAQLKRLPLAAFPPSGQPTSDRDGAAAAAHLPARLTRATVRLVFATRAHVSKLAAVEQELLRAAGKDARDPPSVLHGAVVRYMSQGRHRLDLVAGTAVNAQGALALRLAAFRKLVPVACLSASSSVDDDAAWEGGGGKEVAELAQVLASRLPTCSEVAAACCRLSLGWLWAGQLEAVKAAAQADLASVAALLDDGEAVAAVLPCVAPPMSLPATALLLKPALASPQPPPPPPQQQQRKSPDQLPQQPQQQEAMPPWQQHQQQPQQEAVPPWQQQHQQQQALPPWQQQQQQQPPRPPSPQVPSQQRQPPQQRDVMPSPKRQRTDGGSGVGRDLEPGELPGPASAAPPAAQAAQQPAAPLAAQHATQAVQQSAGPPPPRRLADTPPLQGKPGKSRGGVTGQAAHQAAAQATPQRIAPLAAQVMAPGGRLEALLLATAARVDSAENPGGWHSCAALGSALGTHSKNWRAEHHVRTAKLKDLLLVLEQRGYMHSDLRKKADLFWRLR